MVHTNSQHPMTEYCISYVICRYGFRGVQAVSFSSSGSKLASITLDNSHTCHIWDVTRGTRLLDQKSQPGAPPAVYGIQWSWFEPDRWVGRVGGACGMCMTTCMAIGVAVGRGERHTW